MQVKNIHFLSCCPGLPVYEMMDGSLMMPFSKKPARGQAPMFFWSSEDNLVKGISDIDLIMKLRSPYRIAEDEIKKSRGNTPVDVRTPLHPFADIKN
jgi:hypothetical protein